MEEPAAPAGARGGWAGGTGAAVRRGSADLTAWGAPPGSSRREVAVAQHCRAVARIVADQWLWKAREALFALPARGYREKRLQPRVYQPLRHSGAGSHQQPTLPGRPPEALLAIPTCRQGEQRLASLPEPLVGDYARHSPAVLRDGHLAARRPRRGSPCRQIRRPPANRCSRAPGPPPARARGRRWLFH